MQIDKNIPAPKNIGGAGAPTKWPFTKMEVGDSVLVDGISCSTAHCPGYNAAKQIANRMGFKFTGRAQGDGTVRIWRTA